MIAVEHRLLGLLFGTARLSAAQADEAVKAKLNFAGLVLEQFVDDRAFPRTRVLKASFPSGTPEELSGFID